mmetsp:Transcript_30028/g.74499  ORF Transcript_30028/g.74499 Transcript_30028/m.74499 type:complete len:210 (-) Transcript_30028:429-1058(-)
MMTMKCHSRLTSLNPQSQVALLLLGGDGHDVEVRGGVAVPHGVVAPAVDAEAALHARARVQQRTPPGHVHVRVHLNELLGAVEHVDAADPGEDGEVRDGRLVAAAHVVAPRQLLVQHVQLALGLHGEAVDAVLDVHRGVVVEVAEAAADVGRGARLPEQPVHALGAAGQVRDGGQELGAVLLGQVQQDVRGLEHAQRRRHGVVHHHGDL